MKPLSFVNRIRNYFLTGVVVTAPIAITLLLVWQFVAFFDRQADRLIPPRYNPETYLPFEIPGLGLIVAITLLIVIGIFAAGVIGRALVRLGERLLDNVPVVRSVYATLKQIFETVMAQQSGSFREVVLVEYPRQGLWALAFVTGPTRGEVRERLPGDKLSLFLPTTPNPTSGFLLFAATDEVIHLDMSVEDGIKLVISGGIVTPSTLPIRLPREKRATVAADGRN